MARKDALLSLRAILFRRRDALRSALNGDLTLLKELRSESPGDVIDAAVDAAPSRWRMKNCGANHPEMSLMPP